MRIGLHVSISGRIYESLDRARALGCNAMQIFSRNPRGWQISRLDPDDVIEFRARAVKFGIKPVIVHMPYLVNLASPDKDLYNKSTASCAEDLKRADELGADYLVVHLGSHTGSGEAEGIKRFREAIVRIIDKVGSKTIVLLENTAGSGSSIGYKFEHLGQIMAGVKDSSRIGVCLDTAHAFEAGYDLKTKKGFDMFMDEFDRLIGTEAIKVVHFNDSLSVMGSGVDRHQHIGKGELGIIAMKRIINSPRLKDAAFIMETPKRSDKDDSRNMAVTKRLVRF